MARLVIGFLARPASRRAGSALLLSASLLLTLCFSAGAAEPTAGDIVHYYEWLAAKPNDYKRASDQHARMYAIFLYLHASDPDVAAFLDHNLEALYMDPVCDNCLLYAPAYAGPRNELKDRAEALLRGSIVDGKPPVLDPFRKTLDSPQERFTAVFNALTAFCMDGQGALPSDTPDVLAQLLAELKPDESLWRKSVEDALESSAPGGGKTLAEAFIRRVGGQTLLDGIRRRLMNVSAARLHRVLFDHPQDPNDPAKQKYGQDMTRILSDPFDPSSVRFLGESIEAPLTREFQNNSLYLAAYASGDPSTRSNVIQLLKKRIEGSDSGFNEAVNAFLEEDFKRQHQMYPMGMGPDTYSSAEQRFRQKMAQAPNTLNDLSGRERYFFDAVINGIWSNAEALKQAAVELIVALDLQYDSIAQELEHYAAANETSVTKWIAAEIIRRMKPSGYLDEVRERETSERFESGIKRISQFRPDQPAPFIFNDRDILPALLNNAGRPEVAAALTQNLKALAASCGGEGGTGAPLLTVAYASGNPELRRLAVEATREIINHPPPCYAGWAPGQSGSFADRYRTVFLQALAGAYAGSSPKTFALQTADLFSGLGYEYELFGKQIEPLLASASAGPSGNPAAAIAAHRLVSNLNGKAYLQAAEKRSMLSADSTLAARLQAERTNFDRNLSNIEGIIRKLGAGESIASWEAGLIEQFESDLFKRPMDSEMLDFISRQLNKEPYSREHWIYRRLILAAYAAHDPKLGDQLKRLMEDRIFGRDAQFNATIGSSLTSPDKRFLFYLKELAAAVAAGNLTEEGPAEGQLLPLATELLERLDIPYELYRQSLEEAASRSNSTWEKKLASDLIVRKKGRDYLAALPARPGSERTAFNVYINGGYSPTSNYEFNEQDLSSFFHSLFQSNAIILNAGGLHGGIARNDPSKSYATSKLSGLVPGESSLELGVPVIAATPENVRSTFDSLSKRRPSSVTVIYGGHGNQRGVVLWKADPLSWTQIRDMYARFPEQTTIRSIFLQCFGGGDVEEPYREAPKKIKLLNNFASYYYPNNRCALSQSSQDELNYYLSGGSDWQQSQWARLFSRYPDMSLRRLQGELFSDGMARGSPAITSDYLLSDLNSALCGEMNWLDRTVEKYGNDEAAWPPADRRQVVQSRLRRAEPSAISRVRGACAELSDDPVHDTRKQNLTVINNYMVELDRLLVGWSGDLIRDEFPEFYQERRIDGSAPNVEEIYAQYLNTGKDTGFSPPELHDLLTILASGSLHRVTLLGAFSQSKKYTDYFNNRFKSFLHQPGKAAKYSQYLQAQSFTSGIALASARNAVISAMDQLQSQRRVQERAYRKKQREFLEPLIRDLAELDQIRPRYESIVRCEMSPLEN